jgi:peptidoglycan/xylan/chitin deacetylase (PgdA/CDA1 family)
MPSTVALIYHDIAEPDDRDAVGFPGPLAGRYKHSLDQFRAHLAAIDRRGLPVGLVRADAAPPPVALTFDDGGASGLLMASLLEERDWRGHFFVTTSRIGTPGFLSEREIRELSDRGHEVGSHSHSHPTYMGRLARDVIEREWEESRALLTDILGYSPRTAAVPGGYTSGQVVAAAARAGYDVLMTSDPVPGVRERSGISVLGRFTIWSTTRPSTAAAYASGRRLAQHRLRAEWWLKGVGKRAAPRLYDSLRRVRAGR